MNTPTSNYNWPSGTITFLFTDIEKSTVLWDRHGEQMRTAQARHDTLLRAAVADCEGVVVKTTGDGLHAAFDTAADALSAALTAQRQLQMDPWPEIEPEKIRVRMGLHSGEAQWRDGDYYGTSVNRAARIMGLGHGGQVLLSGVTASLLQEALPSEISLRNMGDHPLRGLHGAEHVFQVVAPDLRADFPPLKSSRSLVGNLPAHLSSFVGRAREMAEIRSALSRTRLLTLTGPGGTGKTRLALQMAADVQAEYEHGAWLVELAPVADPNLVVKTVAGVFGLHGLSDQQTEEMLFDFLREKELLLILDNCEHLITASAQLAADLIAACPRLTILASSREGLGVYGETTYHLPTLNLPSANGQTAKSALRSEAVQLFVERAVTVQPGFNLTDANAPAVAQVVRRLDGIPLAIELAAARLRIFTVDQIAGRLDQRFRLLTGGSRTAMPRQQTLRALIDWSYDLLDEDERDFFRRLSVFVGGWTFAGAESVTTPLDAFSLLPLLISKSLVMRGDDAVVESGIESNLDVEPRYFYLETIRQYARDRLIESGQVEEARDRHFDYYEALSRDVEFGGDTATLAFQGDQLLVERENLRAAVEWSVERYPQRTLDLIWNLAPFISDHLPGTEALDWLSVAIQRLDALPPADEEQEVERRQRARFRGLVATSMLKMFLGQLDEAHQLASEVCPQLREQDADPVLVANSLFVIAQTGYFLEDPALDDTLEEAQALLRTMPDHPLKHLLLAMVLLLTAETESRKGNLDVVERNFKESEAVLANAPAALTAWLEYSRLMIIVQTGMDTEAVRQQYEKLIHLLRETRSSRVAAMAESDWGHRLRREGRLEEAMAIYQTMLGEWRQLGHRAAMANILENIAFIDRLQDRPERALTLLGAAERIREEIKQDMLRSEREEYEQEVAELKRMLPPEEVDRLWEQGRRLSTDAIVSLVSQDVEVLHQ